MKNYVLIVIFLGMISCYAPGDDLVARAFTLVPLCDKGPNMLVRLAAMLDSEQVKADELYQLPGKKAQYSLVCRAAVHACQTGEFSAFKLLLPKSNLEKPAIQTEDGFLDITEWIKMNETMGWQQISFNKGHGQQIVALVQSEWQNRPGLGTEAFAHYMARKFPN